MSLLGVVTFWNIPRTGFIFILLHYCRLWQFDALLNYALSFILRSPVEAYYLGWVDDRKQMSNVSVSGTGNWFSSWINIIKLRKQRQTKSCICHCVHRHFSFFVWHGYTYSRSLVVITDGCLVLSAGWVCRHFHSTAFSAEHQNGAFHWSWLMHLLFVRWGYNDCISWAMTDCVWNAVGDPFPPYVFFSCALFISLGSFWCRIHVFFDHIIIVLY